MMLRPFLSPLSYAPRNAEGGGGGAGDGTAGAGDGGSTAGDSAAGGDWLAGLPAELRSNPNIAKFAGQPVDALATAHISATHFIGKNPADLVTFPAADDAAGRTALLRRLGAPEEVSGYKLTAPENVPAGFEPDGRMVESFLKTAAAAGVLPDQAQAIYAGFANEMATAIGADQTSAKEAQETCQATLREKWGQAFDEYSAAATRAATELGLVEAFEQVGLGNDPKVVEAFSRIGRTMFTEDASEGNGGKGTGTAGVQRLPPEQAQARGKELAYQAIREQDPVRKRELTAQASEYYKQAFPE